MIVQLIILQLIALLLGNYMFKSENIVAKKSSNNRRTPVFHALLIALLSYLLSFDLGFWKAAIFIAFTHLGIDLLKSYSTLTTQYKIRKSTVFFINLLVKLFIFLIAVIVYNHFYNISFYLNLPETKYLATLLAFIFCMKPANTIILHLFSAFNIKTPSETSDTEENKSLENAGKLIGVAERMITLI